MMKIKRNVQGITLIALVVTIIVLLILAGIAINLTIGQNGIFSRAQKSVNTWRNAETNEQLAMGELEKWMANYMGENNGDSDNEDDIGKPVSEEDLGISATNVYYADLDSTGDITVDGIIIADLAGEEESKKWRKFLGNIYNSIRNKFKAILYKRRIYRRTLWNGKSNSSN